MGRVRRAIVDAIDSEGPIHAERLVKMVAGAFDLSRVNANRASTILAHVPRLHYKKDEPQVFWGADVDPTSWTAFRPDEDGTRPLDHVPLREIANAMATICRESGGAERVELLREAMAEFGFRRLTTGIEARMADALAFAERAGVIREECGIYTS
jgi:hypothetical protein